MSEPIDSLPAAARDKAERAAMPDEFHPMLATLTDDHFSDEDWLYERKLDGERCVLTKARGKARLVSRNGKLLNASYPELVEAAEARVPDRLVADGEIVAFDGAVTSFARLQSRMNLSDPQAARATGVAVYFYLFDLPYWDGWDLCAVPLRERKKLLRRAVDFASPLRYTPHRNRDGVAYWRSACEKGWEGVIAKRDDSPYKEGARSRDWLKFKCVRDQEFVIGGYTEPEGSRQGFGALLLGVYDGDRLRYAGMVGTGFDDDLLRRLSSELGEREIDEPPFDKGNPGRKGVHWVKPEMVCEIGFTEWTSAGRLRHPRFQGLRRDKDPRDVVREQD